MFYAHVVFKGENSAVVTVWYMGLTLSGVRTLASQICFNLGMMLKNTELYSLILVWMTLSFWMTLFAEGHRVTGKLELIQSFCSKVAWRSSDVLYGWWRWLWRSPVSMLTMDHFEGFWPEWYISTIYHAWDTPFWLGTLNWSFALLVFSQSDFNSWCNYVCAPIWLSR